MLITLSRRTDICQSVSEVYLTSVAPLGAVSHIFIFFNGYGLEMYSLLSVVTEVVQTVSVLFCAQLLISIYYSLNHQDCLEYVVITTFSKNRDLVYQKYESDI